MSHTHSWRVTDLHIEEECAVYACACQCGESIITRENIVDESQNIRLTGPGTTIAGFLYGADDGPPPGTGLTGVGP